jgi:RND family efflux transporter MFP subunit
VETKKANLSSLRIDKTKREEYSNPRVRKKTILWLAIILFVFIACFIIINGWDSIFSTAEEVELTSVILQSPTLADAILTASGYVVAQRQAAVASKGTGRLIYLGVVEGDKVRKDQVIARLENNDIQAQLDEANANLKLSESELIEAENNLDRQKELFSSKIISESQLEIAETRYKRVLASIELAKARVEAAEVALENTLIRAPFDGTVLTKNADVGEIVAPLAAGANSRAAVVTIADMNSLQVEADVSESNIHRIEVGQDCEITLDAYPDKSYAGLVAKIVPTADRSKATVLVKVGFKKYDEKVLPEMSAKVLFLKEQEKKTVEAEPPLLMIPKSAVVTKNNKKSVFKVKDGKAVEVQIATRRNFSDYLEVTSGVQSGDQVINNPGNKILNGMKITIE